MKKLFSMLLAFITAISTGTSFEVNEDALFVEDYYKVDLKEEPNYRDINNQTISESLASQCKTAAFSSSGKRVEDGYGYWFVNQISVTMDDILDMAKAHSNDNGEVQYILFDGLFKDYNGYYIILPRSGTIKSDFSVSSIHDMTIEIKEKDKVTYILEISNMRCWYCDVGRPGIKDGTNTSDQYHTVEDLKSKDMTSSNVLGVANKDTKIKLIPKAADKKDKKKTILNDFFKMSN